jgi:hypothetical protein
VLFCFSRLGRTPEAYSEQKTSYDQDPDRRISFRRYLTARVGIIASNPRADGVCNCSVLVSKCLYGDVVGIAATYHH